MILRPTESGRLASRVAADGGTTFDLVEVRRAVDEFIARNRDLYDKASLMMIPGSLKTGTLFCVKPGVASADLTVSRNSVKWARDNTGYYRQIPVNVPPFEYCFDAQKLSVSPESQTTNYIQRSWDFSNTYWSKNGTSVDNNNGTGYDCPFVSPAGVNLKKAFGLTEDTGTGTHNTGASVTGLTANNVHTISFFAKDQGRRYILISDDNVGGASQGLFDLQNGVILSGGALSKSMKHIVNGWYLCSVSYTVSATGAAVRLYLHNGSSVSYSGNGSSGILLCQSDLILAGSPRSPIFTDGSTTTRLADLINIANAGSLIGQTEGTIYADVLVRNYPITTTRGIITLSDGTLSNYIRIGVYSPTNALNAYVSQNGSPQINSSFTSGYEGRAKIAIAYKNNDLVFVVNGQVVGSSGTGTVPAGLSLLEVGSLLYARVFDDSIFSVVLSKERISNDELIKYTML